MNCLLMVLTVFDMEITADRIINRLAKMSGLYIVFGVLLFISHPAPIHASPTLRLPLATSPTTSALTADRTSIHCVENKLWDSRLASTRKCLQAIHKLPENPDPGVFSHGFGGLDFDLPRAAAEIPCIATVYIDAGRSDRTSWVHIKSVLGSIAQFCSHGSYPMGMTGGVAYVGTLRHIRIAIGKSVEINEGRNVTAMS